VYHLDYIENYNQTPVCHLGCIENYNQTPVCVTWAA